MIKRLYDYTYYRATKLVLYVHHFGKPKGPIKEVRAPFALMTFLTVITISLVLYEGFGIRFTESVMVWVTLVSMGINFFFCAKQKGGITVLHKRFKKESKSQRAVNGWLLFFSIVFMFVQFCRMIYYQDEHPDFEGIVNLFIKRYF